MFSSQERPPKRRMSEIDHQIKCMSEVISSMTGPEKSYLENRLWTIKLKKQKIHALSAFAEVQKMNGILAEIDILVTENDVNVEIESIRNSKKFKRSEKSLLNRQYCDITSMCGEDIIPSKATNHSAPSTSANRTTDGIPQPQEMPDSTPVGTMSLTKKDVSNYYYEAKQKTTLLIKNKITSESNMFMPPTENVTSVERNQTKPVESTFQEETINTLQNETENLTPSPQTEQPSTSKTIKKEYKMKSSRSKKDKSSKVKESVTAALSNLVTPNLTDRNCATQISNAITDQEMATQTGSVKMLPETDHTHDGIINLFRIYKKIHSPEISYVKSPDSQINMDNVINNNDTSKGSEMSLKTKEKTKNDNVNIVNRTRMCISNESKCQNADGLLTNNIKSSCNTKDSTSSHKSKTKELSTKAHKTDKALKKVHKTDKTSTKRIGKADKEKKTYNSKKNKETNHPKKIIEAQFVQNSEFVSEGTIKPQQTNGNSDTLNDGVAIYYMTELVKQAMQRNATQNASQEDIVNDLFKDLMASKHIKLESDESSVKTTICFQCGLVAEGHMCAYTIRELLEQC